jgi:GNAT superfamily N-acetyltransferase
MASFSEVPPMTHIRRGEMADARGIAVVHVRSWQAAYRGLVPQAYLDGMSVDQRQAVWEELLTAAAWPRRGVVVADEDGPITGFASFCPTRDGEADVGEIAAIYLVPEVWGTGTGRRLMAAALDVLGQAGYSQATLWVLESNARARRFYEAAGWRPDGATKRDVREGFTLDEVRYRRAL